MSRPRISPAFAVSVLALFVALSTTSYAANGEALILGQGNAATAKTTLSAKVGTAALQVSNTKNRPGATALALNVAAANPPFTTTGSGRVVNLNADLLDGLDSTSFLSSIAPQTVSGSDPTSAFSATNTGNGNGVQGITSGAASGVYGENDAGGFGVAGRSNADGGIGVLGEGTGESGLAGKFVGNVQVVGDTTVTGTVSTENMDIGGQLQCTACVPDTALLHGPTSAYVHKQSGAVTFTGGTGGVVASVDLPSGYYLLFATLQQNLVAGTPLDTCTLGENGSAIDVRQQLLDPTAYPLDGAALSGSVFLSVPDSVSVICQVSGAGASAQFSKASLIALRLHPGYVIVQ